MGVAAVGIGAPEGQILAQVLERAANDYQRGEGQLSRANYCAKPVRLSGRVTEVDRSTGEVKETYNTEGEPDKSLLIACTTGASLAAPRAPPATGPTPFNWSPRGSEAAREFPNR